MRQDSPAQIPLLTAEVQRLQGELSVAHHRLHAAEISLADRDRRLQCLQSEYQRQLDRTDRLCDLLSPEVKAALAFADEERRARQLRLVDEALGG